MILLFKKQYSSALQKACVASAVCALLLLDQGQVLAASQEDIQAVKTTVIGQEDLPPKSIAVLRALDKITARITELQVPTGDEGVSFGNLLIKSPQCRSNPPEETPESFVLLTIDELKKNGQSERIFSGWMLASSPALNPLEHPVYDVWAINCRTVSGAGSE